MTSQVDSKNDVKVSSSAADTSGNIASTPTSASPAINHNNYDNHNANNVTSKYDPFNNNQIEQHVSVPRPMHSQVYGPSMHNKEFDYVNMGTRGSGVITAAATGGALALFVASAINWLNGGDFNLLYRTPQSDDEENFENDWSLTEQQQQHQQPSDRIDGFPVDNQAEHTNTGGSNSLENDSFHNTTKMDDILAEMRALKIALSENREVQERYFREKSIEETKRVGGVLTQQAMLRLRDNTADNHQKLNVNEAIKLNHQTNMEPLEKCCKSLKCHLSELDSLIQSGNVATNDKTSSNVCLKQSDMILAKEISSMLESLNKIETLICGRKSECIVIQDNKDKLDEHTSNIGQSDVEMNNSSSPSDENTLTQAIDVATKTCIKAIDVAFKALSDGNDEEALKDGSAVLSMYIKNLLKNPDVPRYQKIPSGNKMFKEKVSDSLVGSKSLLISLGFEENDSNWQWRGSAAIMDDSTLLNEKSKHEIALKTLAYASDLLERIKLL